MNSLGQPAPRVANRHGVVSGEAASRLLSRDAAYWLLCALAVVLGIALRMLGYFEDALQLWLDEASWAVMLAEGTSTFIRPVGYMWLTGVLVNVVNDEQMLRSLSLVGGLLHVPLALAALRLSTSSRWLALLSAYVVAVHPVAIAMSKEFKPYGLELTFHLLLACFALAYLRTDRLAFAAGLVVTAVVAPLFAWSAVFAYPAAFAVVGWRALRARRTLDVVVTAGGAAITLAVLAAIWVARVAGEDEKTEHWAVKYDVFYVGDSRAGGIGWLGAKTVDLAAFPADLELALPVPVEAAVLAALGWACVALSAVGAASLLARRRWALAALWITPWIIAIGFNLAGKWPWGVFRTNLFMLAYATALLCHGLGATGALVARLGQRPYRAAAFGLALVAILAFPLDLGPFETKPRSTQALASSVRTAMERIQALDGPREQQESRTIALDGHACGIFKYYRDHHAETRRVLGSFFAPPDFTIRCSGVRVEPWRALLQEGPFRWVISAQPDFVEVTRADVRESCEAAGGRVDVDDLLPAGTLLLGCIQLGGGAPAAGR